MKKLIVGIIDTLLVLITIGILFIFGQTVVAPESTPEIFKYKALVIKNDDMTSIASKNDLVIVEEKSKDDLEKDQVIVYKQKAKKYIITRVIEVKDEKVTVKTDNATKTEEINVQKVQGVYVWHLKNFGKFISFVQTPKGFAISIISVFILFYVISSIDKLFRWIGILFSKKKKDNVQQ